MDEGFWFWLYFAVGFKKIFGLPGPSCAERSMFEEISFENNSSFASFKAENLAQQPVNVQIALNE